MRYGAITDLPGPDVLSRAVLVFGPAGHGLKLVERQLLHVRLENRIGHVRVEVARTEDGRTDLTIETREYDREAVAFIESLPRLTRLGRWLRQKRGRTSGR